MFVCVRSYAVSLPFVRSSSARSPSCSGGLLACRSSCGCCLLVGSLVWRGDDLGRRVAPPHGLLLLDGRLVLLELLRRLLLAPPMVGLGHEVDDLDVHGLVLVELWRHGAEAVADLVPLSRDVLPVDVGDVNEDGVVVLEDKAAIIVKKLTLLQQHIIVTSLGEISETVA